MSADPLNRVKIQLGVFDGDAPPATISFWQSIVSGDIDVHFDAGSGMKTYLLHSIPAGQDSVSYVSSLVSAGITGAEAVHVMEGNRIRLGWDDFEIIGDQITTISLGVG